MERYGVEWLQKGTHEKHLSVLEFEKKERAKEVAELDSQKQEITSVVAQLGEEVSVKKRELLGKKAEAENWLRKAERLRNAITTYLYCAEDEFFYDLAPHGWRKYRTEHITRIFFEQGC